MEDREKTGIVDRSRHWVQEARVRLEAGADDGACAALHRIVTTESSRYAGALGRIDRFLRDGTVYSR
jgi:hypothetical protein